MAYAMSSSMAQGLTALLAINEKLADYQIQATSGKKINGPADGLASYWSAFNFDDRSKRLSTVNDGITTALSSLKGAKQGLDSISKTLQDLRATLKAASETQAKQAAQGVQALDDSDPYNTMLTMDFKITGRNVSLNENTLLNSNDGSVPQNTTSTTITLGNQKLIAGSVLKFQANGNSINITIGNIVNTSGSYTISDGSITTDDNGVKSCTVNTIGQLVSALKDGLGFNISQTGNANSTLSYLLNYSGPSFKTNVSGQTDLSGQKGIRVSFDSNYSSNINATLLFGSYRKTDTTKNNYVEDKVKNNSTSANTSNDATYYGVQHNAKEAQAAKDPDQSRANAAKSYMQAMSTISQYLNDSAVSGVNLLNGDQLKVTLNEKGMSQTIQLLNNNSSNSLQFTPNALNLVTALGNCIDITSNYFATNTEGGGANTIGLMNAIGNVDKAIETVKAGQFQVASFNALISDRKDFNSGIITLLNQASGSLTAADMTEVSTQMAALQVQQSFAQAILSSTKQADQSILQLLR